ncbi:putative type I restriction enzyme specificity subunit [Mesorhizobium plurifarium]|uniref:Putative type I restriction enzyme specificity subunit n=1 Tax=Mesorhizobium plurifarium TaxID=69974 RepID=A0A090GPR0_MESPL|nr:putative type I restriction enzyme specificity subunit [Mesorhizobium plurifarium]
MSGLPHGWAEVRLEAVAAINPGRIEGLSLDTSVSFVPMPAVSDVDGEIVSPTVRPFAEVSKGYTQFQEGDVIFAKITPCMENGKIAVARTLENGVACGSTEFHVVRPLGGNSPDYIWRFLRQKSFREDAEASMTGAVGQRRVPATYLRDSRLPLPPLPEQRRIVTKIDSLAGKSRRARDHLDHIPSLVEKYKQAVMAAAFRGELTAGARGKHASSGWTKATLAEVCNRRRPITYGVIKLGTEVPGGVPCLRTSNVRWLHIDVQGIKSISKVLSDEYHRTILSGGEVLVNVRGTLGGVAVVPSTMSGWNVSREVAVAAVDAKYVLAEYAAYWIAATSSQQWLSGVERGVAYTGINIEDLRKLPVAYPNRDEQREIVRRIETAFNWIDRLASEATSARRLIDHLDQSVLAKAFQGELVHQDPTDEPADVLLERIRTGRDIARTTRRGQRGRHPV